MVFYGFNITYKFSKGSSVQIFLWNLLFMRNCYNVSGRSKYYSTSMISGKKSSEEAPWRIIFFGSDDFSLASLKPLTAKLRTGTLLSELGVVSGQDTIVHNFAVSEKLPLYDWPPDETVLQKYDLGMVVAFGRLIPEKIIKALPLGILNVHGSLLPRWRGAAPIEHAIMNGDAETGVTIFRIKPHKFDIGDVVRQYRCPVAANETAAEVRTKLASFGAKLLLECVRDLPRCVTMATPQSNEGVSYAPKLNASYARVTWNNMTAQQVYNRYRALSHIYPLTTWWYGRPVRLLDVAMLPSRTNDRTPLHNVATPLPASFSTAACKSALDFLNDVRQCSDDNLNKNSESSSGNSSNIDASPGRVRYSHRQKVLSVECADGISITCNKLRVLQRPMSATDFYNGFLSKVSETNWAFGSQSRETG